MTDPWAIVIPGSGGHTADGYRIGGRALGCLRAAARLAEQRRPQLVVFSGWSPAGGPSEAEQMLEAWPGGRDIELVAETSATRTAENMSRTLPLLLERDIREVTLVCGALHLPRVHYFFGGVYPRYGIRCRYRITRQLPTTSPTSILARSRSRQMPVSGSPSARRRRPRLRAVPERSRSARSIIHVPPTFRAGRIPSRTRR